MTLTKQQKLLETVKHLTLDVWERCLFWIVFSYIVAYLGWILGFSWGLLFITFSVISIVTVIFVDGLTVDPSGKSVLITGCDSGFGLGAAKKFHSLGFTVFAAVLSEESNGAKDLKKKEFHDRMHIIKIDVTSDQDIEKGVEYVKNNLPEGAKGLWAVISNAGWSTFGDFEFMPIDVFQKIIDINLLGTIRTIKASLPLIRRAQGRVVITASQLGCIGIATRSAYTCTKWGVEGVAECLRPEMKRWGVRVAVIEPGNHVGATHLFKGDVIENQAAYMWDKASQVVKDDYGKDRFDATLKKMLGFKDTGESSMDGVLKAYKDAVMQVFPQTRYQVLTPYEKLRCFMGVHSPSVLYDAIFN